MKEPTKAQKKALKKYNKRKGHTIECVWEGKNIRLEFYPKALGQGYVAPKEIIIIASSGNTRRIK